MFAKFAVLRQNVCVGAAGRPGAGAEGKKFPVWPSWLPARFGKGTILIMNNVDLGIGMSLSLIEEVVPTSPVLALAAPAVASEAPKAKKGGRIPGSLMLRRDLDGTNWCVRANERGEVLAELGFVGKWNDGTKAKIAAKLKELGKFPEGQVFTYHGDDKVAATIVGGEVLFAV